MGEFGITMCCLLGTVGTLAILGITISCLFEHLGGTLSHYVRTLVELHLATLRAEHEAKINLIKGLD